MRQLNLCPGCDKTFWDTTTFHTHCQTCKLYPLTTPRTRTRLNPHLYERRRA